MSLCLDTKAAVNDATDRSIREIFATMAATDLEWIESKYLLPTRLDEPNDPTVTVMLGLTGDLQGFLSVLMSEAAALRWTSKLLMSEVTEVDQDVVDAIGELGNMVVGGTKRRLTDFDLTMSLPTVMRVGLTKMEFPSGIKALQSRYEADGNRLDTIIALQMS